MKTLLCVIAAIAFLALPVLAEDVKVTFDGSRLAAGYMDNGAGGDVNPGTFAAPDVKVKLNATFDADTSAVLRLNFDDATANGADYAYVKLTNVIKRLAKNDMVNPDIYVGAMKINFGEETWSNNPVENALVENSQGGVSGVDLGIEFRQPALNINLPVVLGYSLSFMNGGYNAAVSSADDTNAKAYALKVMAQMKSQPLYFSLSQYDSGKLGPTSTSAMDNMTQPAWFVATAPWYIKGYELNVRFDMLEGAQKFDPSKAPLFSDAKGVFRLAYGSYTLGDKGATANRATVGTIMLDAIYNVDKQWYVAFRYSYDDVDIEGVTTGDVGKTTKMSIGGGHKLSDKAILKLDYTTNTESDTLLNPKLDNDQVALLMTVLW